MLDHLSRQVRLSIPQNMRSADHRIGGRPEKRNGINGGGGGDDAIRAPERRAAAAFMEI
jgi:hypothetical protein